MTHEFKPGDKVRLKAICLIVDKQADHVVHLRDGTWTYAVELELVEPSVTHRELREVLEELTKTTLQNDFNAGWNDALDAFFTQATGEQP